MKIAKGALPGALLSLLVACGTSDQPASELVFVDLDGRTQKPLVCGDQAANVMFFITNDCPIANAMAPEIQAIVNAHQDSPLQFLLVHVDPDISNAIAGQHAKDFQLRLPIVLDHRHDLVRRLGITITPEVAVWSNDDGLFYRGRINDLFADLGQKRRAPTSHDLRDALQALLTHGKLANQRTQAIGCDIPDPSPDQGK